MRASLGSRLKTRTFTFTFIVLCEKHLSEEIPNVFITKVPSSVFHIERYCPWSFHVERYCPLFYYIYCSHKILTWIIGQDKFYSCVLKFIIQFQESATSGFTELVCVMPT